MLRKISDFIKKDLEKKIVLLSGPRQVGKTTLSKDLTDRYQYLNYDSDSDRLLLKEKSWDRANSLIIFDEIHKLPQWKSQWKRWIKGIYDTEGIPPSLLVTGSARLDIARKMGDSLAGRYFQYRLHPIDLKEAKTQAKSWNEKKMFQKLLKQGGFPEPFFSEEPEFYPRWRKSHLDIILRQDLLDLESVRNISGFETLIALLRTRVGSTVSYSSLARDLKKDPKTVKRWTEILENLYVIFKVTPYHKNIARALLKEPKFYFYDCGQVIGDEGARLENLIACSLLKELQFLEDTLGLETKLHFIRNKQQQEIDFAIVINSKLQWLIESKWSDDQLSTQLQHLGKLFPAAKKIQLVGELSREKTFPSGEEIRSASRWLSQMDLSQPEKLQRE